MAGRRRQAATIYVRGGETQGGTERLCTQLFNSQHACAMARAVDGSGEVLKQNQWVMYAYCAMIRQAMVMRASRRPKAIRSRAVVPPAQAL